MKIIAVANLALLWLAACTAGSPSSAADVIYSGGDIVTVHEAQPGAEALAVKDGKILAVGSRADIERAHKGGATRSVDLAGRTLLPGFVDAHSHFNMALQVSGWANVSSPPVGPVKNIPELLATLKAHAGKAGQPKDAWVIAYGYDANELAEKRDLTADDLDPVSPAVPVVVLHVSNHGAVLNSAALKHFKIHAGTPTPAGGVIARKPGSQEPAGLLMETAFLPIFASMPQPSEEAKFAAFKTAQLDYARNGYTTAQEGATHYADYELLRKAAERKLLFIDVVALPLMTDLKAFFGDKAAVFGSYTNRLRLGGVKLVTDGSPQGRTAYFTKPHLTDGPTGQKDWLGEPTLPQEQYSQLIKTLVERKIQTYSHASGDAAIDMVLKGLAAAGVKAADGRRDVVIHSQFMRPDHLDRYVELGLWPSFFTAHAFYWGDVHVTNLGEARASFLSPLAAAKAKGLRFSNHTDYTIIPLDPGMPLWSAVTRLSRSGKVIGPDQRVDAATALKALTLDAAGQYHEDKAKGSLEPGKLADLVILDKNPLKVPAGELRTLKVLETIKEGVTIFPAPKN